MDKKVRQEIYSLIFTKLDTKLSQYSPESEHKPFISSILPKRMIAIHSVVQSLYTSIGMSIYEQLAVMLSEAAGYEVHRQYRLAGDIDMGTTQLIDRMWEHDKEYGSQNKLQEIEAIRKSIYPAREPVVQNDSVVDLFIRRPDGHEFYIDIKTVKPNKENFQSFKRKLLRWVGYRLSVDKNAKVNTFIAIPYNPYYPMKYLDSMRGGIGRSLDAKYDILVQEEFWNLVGGTDTTYDDLLEIFRQVGDELKPHIDKIFKETKGK